jgi:competence ComEA-like helix-hairpin-helix protein
MGPYQTTRETLMVQGVTRRLFFGQDYKQNELIDYADQMEKEKNGSDTSTRDGVAAPDQSQQTEMTEQPPTTSTSSKGRSSKKNASKRSNDKEEENPNDAGWNSLLTVDSAILNQNASGKDRININTASEADLAGIQGFTPEIARAVVQYREKKKFKSIADILDVTPSQNQGEFGRTINEPVNTGESVISQDLFQQVADDITVDDAKSQQGLVNINTASADVLACLPGMTPELALAITSYRQSTGFFQNIGWLMQVQGITREIFQQVAPRITARSETFRILSEGKVLSSGVKQRVQVIVQVTKDDVKTLSYREDL